MRRSTTFAGTDASAVPNSNSALRRALLGLALLAQLTVALILVRPAAAAPADTPSVAAPAVPPATASPPRTVPLRDGRTAQIIALGPAGDLSGRIAGEIDGAAAAVTAFWGDGWPRHIEVVVAGDDEQFRALAGGAPDIAATTTAQRITFSPQAAVMSPGALRIVLRHELFHYAARSVTATDAPRWLTEGVADYVGRPAAPLPADTANLAQLPTDADLDTTGPSRSLAYDRAWWFSRYVADRYGVAALKALYVAACGVGHSDVDTAVAQTLRTGLPEVLAGWRRSSTR